LAVFDIAELREVMSYDEMELDRIGDRKTAAFFIISDTDSTYNFIVALAFSQMFNLLCERADNKWGGRLPHHVRILWDEAANTGQVPHLEKLVAVIRSREVSLCLFLQAQSQLKALYKDHAETIMGNMDSVIFLGGREHTTVKELSEALGKSTIATHTESRTRGQQESFGLNLQQLGRELMTIDELTSMDGNKCILQLRGLRPFFSPKYDLRKHPNFKHTGEADKKNTFDAAKLISTKLTVAPGDLFTVHDVDVSDELTGEDSVNEDIDMDILDFDDVDDPDALA
jgi:type IV secretion system protein VirD4